MPLLPAAETLMTLGFNDAVFRTDNRIGCSGLKRVAKNQQIV